MRHSIYHTKSVLGYSGPEWLYQHGFSRHLNGPFFDKNLQPKAVTKAFEIEELKQRHKFIPMDMSKALGGIITGFEVAIQVFDGRIVLRIFGVQKSSQTQTFSNKASF